ncbi:MAG: hypothetical protein GTO03_15170 [Planctomycetales bacterium]|nr:hypothetical protein [Planctomycetales bacterium]
MTSETKPSSPVFSDHADPAVAAERVSLGAVASLLLGLTSAAALLHPYLWFTAGVGLLVAGLTLIRLHRRQPPPPGCNLALAGFLLAVLFASWAPTSYYLRQYRLNQQAIAVSQQWLRFVTRGQLQKAFAATEDPLPDPAAAGPAPRGTPDTPEGRAKFARFQNSQLVKALSQLGRRGAQVEHDQSEEQFQREGVDRFSNLFTIRYTAENLEPKTIVVRVRVDRTDNPITTTGFWRIMSYQQVSLPPGPRS